MALDDEKSLTKTLMAQIQDKNATLEDLRQKNRNHQKKVGGLIESNDKKELVIEEMSAILERKEKLVVGLKKNMLIVKGNEKQQREGFLRYSVCQAEISNRLAKTLFFVRAVVHTVNPSVLLPKGTVAGTSEEIEAEKGELRREKEVVEEREKEMLIEEEKKREMELREEEEERTRADERGDGARKERSVSKVGSRESLIDAEDSAAVSFALEEADVQDEGQAGSRYLSNSLRVQALKDRWRGSFLLFLEWAQTAKGDSPPYSTVLPL